MPCATFLIRDFKARAKHLVTWRQTRNDFTIATRSEKMRPKGHAPLMERALFYWKFTEPNFSLLALRQESHRHTDKTEMLVILLKVNLLSSLLVHAVDVRLIRKPPGNSFPGKKKLLT